MSPRSGPGDPGGHPIGINLSPNPGSCRGESGWVDVVWAFMVARGKGGTAHRRELKEIGKKEGNREDISLLW